MLLAGVLLGLLAAVVHFSAPRTLAEGQLSRLVGGKWFDRDPGDTMFVADMSCETTASGKCDATSLNCPQTTDPTVCASVVCYSCNKGVKYRSCIMGVGGCTWAGSGNNVCGALLFGNCVYSVPPQQQNARCWCDDSGFLPDPSGSSCKQHPPFKKFDDCN